MDNAIIVAAARKTGANLLPSNSQWQNRLEIRSETSSRLYIVAQRKSDLSWGCSCPGWRTKRHCKHLASMLPLLTAPAGRPGVR